MVSVYPAQYHDAQGDEQTQIENDGKQLRFMARGATFIGDDFDLFEPTLSPSDPRLASFTFNRSELCAYRLEWVMPLPVVVERDVVAGRLWAQLELGSPRPDGTRRIDHESLRLCLSFGETVICSKGTSGGWFEDELRDIQGMLPSGVYFTSCFSCAFSDYSPVGHGLFGCLACFRDNKGAYLQIKSKYDLFAVWDTMTEFVQETYCCPEFQRRQPGAGYRG